MMSRLTFAIGDVHGCLDALVELVEQCRRTAGEREAQFIFLGDYIDRGPDSCGVVSYLIEMQAARADTVICLQGNHEDALLAAADDPLWEDGWLKNGGDQTLASYGVRHASDIDRGHLDWMRQLPKFYDDGLHYFVHAGVRPGRPLNKQDDYDLMTIRKPFLSSTEDFGRLIVHGHTPLKSGIPEMKPNRLNLDTGVVFGGRLTAAAFGCSQSKPTAFLTSTSVT